jgi:DNA-binding response OmpR family regulator
MAGYKFGADYYLTKPVTPRRLLRGIGLVLGREIPE